MPAAQRHAGYRCARADRASRRCRYRRRPSTSSTWPTSGRAASSVWPMAGRASTTRCQVGVGVQYPREGVDEADGPWRARVRVRRRPGRVGDAVAGTSNGASSPFGDVYASRSLPRATGPPDTRPVKNPAEPRYVMRDSPRCPKSGGLLAFSVGSRRTSETADRRRPRPSPTERRGTGAASITGTGRCPATLTQSAAIVAASDHPCPRPEWVKSFSPSGWSRLRDSNP
jgi:hypothetical protein